MPQRQKLDPIHLDILDLLQRDGGWVTSRALHERLRPSYGHSPAAAKTIQRALQRLLDGGFIEGAGNSSARTWRHLTGRTPNKAEVKSVELAVALLQLEQYAANQLPAQSLQILRDYCDRSRELLHSHPTYPRYVQGRDWRGKTAVIDSSYPLLPPALDEGIMDAITQALYRGTALALRYQNASVPTETPQDYQVSPLALVERGSVLYLVSCRRSRSTGSYVRYLHRVDRITRASAADTPADPDPGFELERFLRQEHTLLFFPETPQRITLQVREHRFRSRLRQYRLSADQTVKETPYGFELSATVSPSLTFKQFLLGLAPDVVLVEPASLRQELKQVLEQAHTAYSRAGFCTDDSGAGQS